MRTTATCLLTFGALCGTVLAGNSIGVGKAVAAGDGGIEVPVILNVDVDLSCLSVILSYPPQDIRVAKDGLDLTASRLPWRWRSVLFTVKEKDNQLVFTVADLLGQNTMVVAGEGPLFTIAGKTRSNAVAAPPLKILKVSAFDRNGNSVQVSVMTEAAQAAAP